jgi:peptide/nickel transport system permease protein
MRRSWFIHLLSVLARRSLQLLALWMLLSALGIAVVRSLPGDPAEHFLLLQNDVAAEDLQAVRAAHGLDQPPLRQWLHFWFVAKVPWHVAVGHTDAWGMSRTHQQPAWAVMFDASDDGWSRWRWSLWLHLPPFLFALCVALCVGVWCTRPSATTKLPHALMTMTTLMLTIPSVVLTLGCVALVGAWRDGDVHGWPLLGARSTQGDTGVFDLLQHALLPWSVLMVGYVPALLRLVLVRANQVWMQPHVEAARAYGSSWWRCAWHDVAPLVFGSLCGPLAAWVPAVVGGAVVVESVFAWPGLARLQLESVQQRDVWLSVLILMVLTTVAWMATTVLDVMRAWLSPHGASR